MAATDNIGTTKKTLTQREFFKNMFEFFSATTLTDAVVDEKAPAVIEDGKFFSSWPTGQGYEPTKCLPKFVVNKTISGNTSFWERLNNVIEADTSLTVIDKPYTSTNSPYNFKDLETNQLISHHNIDTPFETTRRIKDFVFSFNVTPLSGLSTSSIYPIFFSAATMSNGEDTTDLLWTCTGNNWNTKSSILHKLGDGLLFADKTATVTPYMKFVLDTSATTTSATQPIPMVLNRAPTITDNKEITWTLSGSTTGPTTGKTGYSGRMFYPSAITYTNFPTKLIVNLSIKRAGTTVSFFVNRLINTHPSNLSTITFYSSMSSGYMCVYPTLSSYNNNMEWFVATESGLNSRYNWGTVESPYIKYNKTEEWDEDKCHRIHLYGCANLTSATTQTSEVPRYVFSLPGGGWLMPLSGSTTSAGTAVNIYYRTNSASNFVYYITTANYYIAKQLKLTNTVYLDGVSTGSGTYDWLVPPSFTFRIPSASTVIFKIDGVQIYSKSVYSNAVNTFTFHMNMSKFGGYILEISY